MRIPGIPYHQGVNNYPDSDGRHFGIAIHNTSNNATDTGEANYADHRPDGVSAHFYCDADSVTQSLDTDAKAGHAGSVEGNENAIAVEITGFNTNSRDWWLSNVAWDRLGQVLAYIITHDPDYVGFQVRRASVAEMRANPKVKALYGHDDMRQAWGHTTHVDPGPNFPWDRLISSIKAHLTQPTEDDAMFDDLASAQNSNSEHYLQSMVGLTVQAEGISDTVNKDLKIPNRMTALLFQMSNDLTALKSTIAGVDAKVQALALATGLDPAALKAAVGAAITEKLPAIADAVLDEDHARSAE